MTEAKDISIVAYDSKWIGMVSLHLFQLAKQIHEWTACYALKLPARYILMSNILVDQLSYKRQLVGIN